jgi:Domain of unknown function (DUF1905)/Bacteriocin-protection, YdeI or OmpD-Associated
MPKGPGGAWTYLSVPFDVHEVFGSKARVSVKGTINGHPFYNSLMPEGDGTHSMMVSKELQAGAKVRPGDLVQVSVELDTGERKIKVPKDLRHALRATSAASFFDGLTSSQKKECVDWICSAKQSTTRANRVKRAINMFLAGKKHVR